MSKNIIFILGNNLQVIFAEKLLSRLIIENVEYENILNSDFIGFYDWLRVEYDKICGIRINPFDFVKKTLGQIPRFSYLRESFGGGLEIYFTDNIRYIEKISCDQDFGATVIYQSDAFQYAIGFNLESLTLAETGFLQRLLQEKLIDPSSH